MTVEYMHGVDEVQVHDFNPVYYCGNCGAEMKCGKSGCICPNCQMRFQAK